MCLDEDELLKFLYKKKFFEENILCPTCGSYIKINLVNRVYRCGKTIKVRDTHKKYCRVKCNKRVSIFQNTIFEHSKISVGKICIILATHVCFGRISAKSLSIHLDVNLKTVYKYIKICEIIVARWVKDRECEKLGGEGKIVQVDETKIGIRKFQKGRYIGGVWLFGGVEVGTNKTFFIPVKRRDFHTLSSIIKKRVKMSTTIYSDCWRGYSGLNNINYKHKTVNHRKGFVNHVNGTNTQKKKKIERVWRSLKDSIGRVGVNKHNLNRRISKFVFTNVFDDQVRIDALFLIVSRFSK